MRKHLPLSLRAARKRDSSSATSELSLGKVAFPDRNRNVDRDTILGRLNAQSPALKERVRAQLARRLRLDGTGRRP